MRASPSTVASLQQHQQLPRARPAVPLRASLVPLSLSAVRPAGSCGLCVSCWCVCRSMCTPSASLPLTQLTGGSVCWLTGPSMWPWTSPQACRCVRPRHRICMLQAVSKRHTKMLRVVQGTRTPHHTSTANTMLHRFPADERVRAAHTPRLPCLCCHAPRLSGSCQVVPTVDNMLESVVALTAAALALPADALLTPHRLDVGTSGIVLLAKNPAFACWFSTLLKNKSDAVVKTYRCLSAAPPPCGPMVHWAVMKQRAAGEPAHTRMLLECAVRDAYSSSGSSGSGGGGGCCSDANVAPCPPVEGAVRCELIVEKVSSLWVSCCRKGDTACHKHGSGSGAGGLQPVLCCGGLLAVARHHTHQHPAFAEVRCVREGPLLCLRVSPVDCSLPSVVLCCVCAARCRRSP